MEKVPTGIFYWLGEGDVKHPVHLFMDQHGELFLIQKGKVRWSHKSNKDMYSLYVSDSVHDYVDDGQDMFPYSHSSGHTPMVVIMEDPYAIDALLDSVILSNSNDRWVSDLNGDGVLRLIFFAGNIALDPFAYSSESRPKGMSLTQNRSRVPFDAIRENTSPLIPSIFFG
ncbi:hypothetical protein Tco_0717382 [Tanacetum coccineum]